MRSNDGEGEDAKGVKAMQKYLEAGKVATHGVRGEMKLELWCDGVAFLKKVGRLYTTPQGGRCYKITSIRPQGQMALLQLEGVSDMDAARALRGQVFYCGMPIPARCTASSPAWTTPAHRISTPSRHPAARNICSPGWMPF